VRWGLGGTTGAKYGLQADTALGRSSFCGLSLYYVGDTPDAAGSLEYYAREWDRLGDGVAAAVLDVDRVADRWSRPRHKADFGDFDGLARYCFPGTQVYMIPLIYLSLMVPANLLFHLACIWRRKLQPAQGAAA